MSSHRLLMGIWYQQKVKVHCFQCSQGSTLRSVKRNDPITETKSIKTLSTGSIGKLGNLKDIHTCIHIFSGLEFWLL